MRRAWVFIFLAWWFAIASTYQAGRMVGPFPTREACELIRADFQLGRSGMVTWTSSCWNDGK